MPLASSALSLDIVKSPFAARSQRVCVRVGDRGAYSLSVALLKDGSPLPMSGLSATLKAVLADGTYAEAACAVDDAAAGLVSCTLGGAFAAVPGACREAYVEVAQGASVVGSTGSFELLVERGADLSAGQAKAYASRVDALAERAEGLADGLEETIASADITVSATRLDPGSDPTVTATGNGLQKVFDLGLPSATAGVSCEAGPSDMVTVHGAADDAPLVEATVFGETRQNLWVNPVGESNGIKAVENTDGSVTVSGTAINSGQLQSKAVHTLKPGAEYNASGGNIFIIYEINDNSSIIATHICNGATFITSLDMKFCIFALYSDAGVTRTGTYRVMLNEGDATAPWSPPGLASVESVEVVACGGNLLPPFPKSSMGTYNGVTFSESEDGFIKISGSNTIDTGVTLPDTGPNTILVKGEYVLRVDSINNMNGIYVRLRLNYFYGEKPIEDIETAGDYNFTLLKTEKIYTSPAVHGIGQPGYENSVSGSVRISIYKKNDYTGKYERYSASTCPVPLPAAHPYLASLPDGTRDELRVHWDGTAELMARVSKVKLAGKNFSRYNNEPVSYVSDNSLFNRKPHEKSSESSRFIACDKIKIGDSAWYKGNTTIISTTGTNAPNYIYIRIPGVTELDEAQAWIDNQNITVMYDFKNTVTYYYDGSTWSTTRPARGSLPTLRSAGDPTHVWASTEPTSVPAEVSAHVLLEGGKALGAEHDYVRRAVDALAAAQSVSESE